jgi:MoaA/NifB/PqqE/SkfB family radical SAM enzyme
MNQNYTKIFNTDITGFFRDVIRISLSHPFRLVFFIKTWITQNRAATLRTKQLAQGVHVPPIMIFSVTNKCNLNCAGCYNKTLQKPGRTELDTDKISDVLRQASDLGISIVLLSGGEPLMKRGLFDVTAKFNKTIFALFTNGQLIKSDEIATFRKQKHVIPVLSIEGDNLQTDSRRGTGVADHITVLCDAFNWNKIFFGMSLTVTRDNFSTIFDTDYIASLVNTGCKLFFFVEYVPVQPGTEDLIVTDEQRSRLRKLMLTIEHKYPALFVSFPGSEHKYGGCLASGRGFIHVNAYGQVEPCPFAPYSDTDLTQVSLKQALQSQLLKTIRDNHAMLQETKSGCALWEKRDWLKSLVP